MRARHVFAFALVTVAVACGGRSYEVLLDPAASYGADGTGAGGSTTTGAGGDAGQGGLGGATTTTTTTASGGGGEGGSGGGPPPNPIDCIACIGQSCPEVLTCIQDPVCSQGLFCTVSQCLGGGAPDLMCVADCFGGDIGAALDALQVFSCVFGSCGDVCGGLFPFPGG